MSAKLHLAVGLVAGIGLLGLGGSLASADDATMHHHHDMSGMVMVSTASYTVPDVQLLRENGKREFPTEAGGTARDQPRLHIFLVLVFAMSELDTMNPAGR